MLATKIIAFVFYLTVVTFVFGYDKSFFDVIKSNYTIKVIENFKV